jgi:hypothetical protein
MAKVSTIQDKHGEVWTGREKEPDTVGRLASAAMTLGMSELLPSDTTVVVNGEEHTGKKV